MAKIKLSVLVDSMRGKVNNGIFQVWKGIQIVRKMPAVISQPMSTNQVTARNLLADARAAYNALSGPDKPTWNEMAEQIKDYPMPPGGIDQMVPGLGGAMSGFNCFISFYCAAVNAGHAPLSGPAPLAEARPTAPSAVATSYDNVTHTLTTTWADPTESDAGAKLRIWLRSKQGIYHKQKRENYALAALTSALTSANGAKGGNIAFEDLEAGGNDRVYVQMDCVNPSGLRSMGSVVSSDGIN